MSSADIYRAKAEDLLKQAMETADLGQRSELISQAVHWHALAGQSRLAAGAVLAMDDAIDLDDPDPAGPDTAPEQP